MPRFVCHNTLRTRTVRNRSAFHVVVRNTYGTERVVYRTNSEDDARCFYQELHLGAGDYNAFIRDNRLPIRGHLPTTSTQADYCAPCDTVHPAPADCCPVTGDTYGIPA